MLRLILTLLLALLPISALLYAQAPLPAAQFMYPHDCAAGPQGVCDGSWPDLSRPGIGSQTYPLSCAGQPGCEPWTLVANGTVEGYAFGDGAPEVMARMHLVNFPSVMNTGASVSFFIEVVGNGTDPFGALDLVPLTMDYFIGLNAFPQVQAKVTGFARVDLLNTTFFDNQTLLLRRVCSSTSSTGTDACSGSNPHNPSVFEGGTLRFFVLGSNRYRLLVDVATQMRCLPGGSACHAFGGGYLDPLPVLDLAANPLSYGRPAGFRLQDHYQIRYSPNHILGPRRPGEVFRDGFQTAGP